MKDDIESKVFSDLCTIADKYETNLICVLDIYTSMEIKYSKRIPKPEHTFILKHTEEYYRRLKKC